MPNVVAPKAVDCIEQRLFGREGHDQGAHHFLDQHALSVAERRAEQAGISRPATCNAEIKQGLLFDPATKALARDSG